MSRMEGDLMFKKGYDRWQTSDIRWHTVVWIWESGGQRSVGANHGVSTQYHASRRIEFPENTPGPTSLTRTIPSATIRDMYTVDIQNHLQPAPAAISHQQA